MVVTGSLVAAVVDDGSPGPASGLCGAGARAIRLRDETRGVGAELAAEPDGSEVLTALGDGTCDGCGDGDGDCEGDADVGGVPAAPGDGGATPDTDDPAASAPMIPAVVPVPLAPASGGDGVSAAGGLASICAAGAGVDVVGIVDDGDGDGCDDDGDGLVASTGELAVGSVEEPPPGVGV
jgi:hypothetical protein